MKTNLFNIYKSILAESTEKKKKVFLGGTWNKSKWRDDLIKKLKINYFNPIVSEWTEEAKKEEIKQRKNSDFVLYVITPKMTGVYSIAEVVDDSNKQPKKTILCVLNKDETKEFNKKQQDSINEVKNMVKRNGEKVFDSLDDVAKYLNKEK